jgi:hypothetical protein
MLPPTRAARAADLDPAVHDCPGRVSADVRARDRALAVRVLALLAAVWVGWLFVAWR